MPNPYLLLSRPLPARPVKYIQRIFIEDADHFSLNFPSNNLSQETKPANTRNPFTYTTAYFSSAITASYLYPHPPLRHSGTSTDDTRDPEKLSGPGLHSSEVIPTHNHQPPRYLPTQRKIKCSSGEFGMAPVITWN